MPAQTDQQRLRSDAARSPFCVLLVEPEIPPNTGNIARLCAATGTPLHLVGKLGFRIDEHAVRRAGLDYWHLVQLQTHASFGDARQALGAARRFWFLSGQAQQSYLDIAFHPGDALVFGKESTGLDRGLLDQNRDHVIGIPMPGQVRSLNLSNAVAIVLYEAMRQSGMLASHQLR